MSKHSFKPEIAEIVGVTPAVIYENICYWVEKNQANNKHFYDGRTWTYNSISAFQELFKYLSRDQIKRAIKKLLDAGLIEKGQFNKAGYDRTMWYSIQVLPIGRKPPMDSAKTTNALGENHQPIPDSKPDNKHNSINKSARAKEDVRSVYLAWNEMAQVNGLSQIELSHKNFTRDAKVISRIKDCGGNVDLVLKAIANVPSNPFWLGSGGGDWSITLGWLLKPDKFSEVLEYTPPQKSPETRHAKQHHKFTDPARLACDNRRAGGLKALEQFKANRMAEKL